MERYGVGRMKPTDDLKKEHNTVKLMLTILAKISEKLTLGDDVASEHLDRILEFFKIFVDKCHHAKEEDALFPEMEKVGVLKDGGPIGVMLSEHEAGRNYVKEIGKGISEYNSGNRGSAAIIVENAKKYIELLTLHIEKEDYVLYSLADKRLPKKIQELLIEKFEDIEQNIIGAGKHEEFHKLLKQLKAIYVK